jgi:hypothetical protein
MLLLLHMHCCELVRSHHRRHGKVLTALLFEHLLLVIKFFVADIVEDQPLWVREKLALKEVY